MRHNRYLLLMLLTVAPVLCAATVWAENGGASNKNRYGTQFPPPPAYGNGAAGPAPAGIDAKSAAPAGPQAGYSPGQPAAPAGPLPGLMPGQAAVGTPGLGQAQTSMPAGPQPGYAPAGMMPNPYAAQPPLGPAPVYPVGSPMPPPAGYGPQPAYQYQASPMPANALQANPLVPSIVPPNPVQGYAPQPIHPSTPAANHAPVQQNPLSSAPWSNSPPVGAPPHAVPDPDKAKSLAAWAVLSQGRQLVRSGHPEQALPIIRQFIATKPLEPEGYFWQGVAFDNMNKTEDALDSYRKGIQQVLKVGMDSAELRMNAGNVMLKEGKTAEAIIQYKRAATIDPGLALVQLNLGRALTQSGDIEAALACFQRCEELRFEPAQLAYYRAKAFIKAGRKDDARAQINLAIARLPQGHEMAAKIKQEFAELLQN